MWSGKDNVSNERDKKLDPENSKEQFLVVKICNII